jgi:multiple sugar transport system substrate-binding protein
VKKVLWSVCFVLLTAAFLGYGAGFCVSSASAADVTLDFSQWWEPELPSGALRGLMDKFESENPGVKVNLLSGPYDNTREMAITGAATGTLSDVVGLDGAWVFDFAKQEAIANITAMIKEANYNDSELAAQVKVGGNTYMIPVVNFVYPIFINDDLMAKAGVTAAPKTRSEFAEAAKKLAAVDQNTAGYCFTMNLENPTGIQNDVLSWVWASGDGFIKDGKANLNTPEVKSVITMMKELYDAGAISPGINAMKEQDKVEEFTNGRLGIMQDTLAHINMIRERNPNLKFSISQMPVKDGFTGKAGLMYATWGAGISATTKHPAEAFKLVAFLMRADVNKELAAFANALPGNKNSTPDFADTDPLFEQGFKIFQNTYLQNEFTGLPQANELQTTLSKQFQLMLDNDKTIDEMLADGEAEWNEMLEAASR